MTRHQKELEKQLLGQLAISSEDLDRWQKDPFLMDSATVLKFWDYVAKAPHIVIVGDYDCDGITASYIMSKAIKSKYPDKKCSIRIPKRHTEGYGINPSIISEIKEKVPKDGLIITVDNGIAAAPLLEDLKKSGYKVLLTDHHEKGANKLPEVDMILNPAVDGCNEAFVGKYWCGAAVAYKIAEQVVSKPLAKEFEVYAGLATIADCMQLTEGNWGLVKRAISQFRRKTSPLALNELLTAMKQQPEYANEDTFGYYLGPAFNAAGRLFDDGPNIILQYLFSSNEQRRDQIVEYNNRRKDIRDQEYELVEEAIKAGNQQNSCPIWVYVPNLHEGIVGILAGMVTENYHVPAIVLTDSKEEGVYKGSARSIPEVNIFEYLVSNHDLLLKYGGHQGAAGLSIKAENLRALQRSQLHLSPQLTSKHIDSMAIEKDEIPQILDVVEKFSPFGEGNPVPYFSITVNVSEDHAKMVGADKNHLIIDNSRESDGGYKIMHFFHDPNELSDKNTFKAIGNIHLDGFRGSDYAAFNTEEIEDIHDDRELGR